MPQCSYEVYVEAADGPRFVRLITCADEDEALSRVNAMLDEGFPVLEVRRLGEHQFTVRDPAAPAMANRAPGDGGTRRVPPD